MDLALSRPLPIAACDYPAVLVTETSTDGAGHDIPGADRPPTELSRAASQLCVSSAETNVPPDSCPAALCLLRVEGAGQRKRARAAPSDRSPSRRQRAWSPLSTGCPGPFQAQPPVHLDERRSSPLRRHALPRGPLDARALQHDVART